MILCLGLTPALQRTLLFKSLDINEVNRACQVVESAAGKSLNTARAIALLGLECRVAGFNGGYNGELINQFMDNYGVDSALTPMSGETRICTTLLDQAAGTVTELVEEAPEPTKAEVGSFIETNVALIKRCKMLVISGTLPPYAGDDFYCHFTAAAASAGVPFVIDSHRSALLNVLEHRPLVAKLNLRELETTFSCSIESDVQIEESLNLLLKLGARSVFMTQGKDAAWLVNENGVVKLTPPDISKHVNPIGSGDCTTAGIAVKLLEGAAFADAARYGLACGSANVETLTPADLDIKRVAELHKSTL